MKTIRYFFLMVFVLAPGLALAQDSLTVDIGGVEDAGAYASNFGFDITGAPGEVVIGPSEFVPVVGDGTTVPDNPEYGCDPYTAANAADVAGNVAVIARGGCSFVIKVQNAVAAGASAALIYVSDPESACGSSTCGQDGIVSMGGDCTVDGEPPAGGCSIPAISTSLSSGLAILTEAKFGEEGTATCETCTENPTEPANVVIDNGTVLNSLFGAGFIGNNPEVISGGGFGEGFTFAEEDGLFVSSFLIGVDGNVTSNPYDGVSEFTSVEDPVLLTEVPDPFDVGARSVFTSPLGFTITLSGYADADAPNNDFVVYNAAVENTSGADINGVYLGIFADWDAGETTSTDDAAGVDPTTNLVYVFDPVEVSAYFGVAALADPNSLSGYSTDATTADDAELFTALTTTAAPGADPAERAAVSGLGPFNIAAGATQNVQFAFIGGTDLTDLLANAAAAQLIDFDVAVEASTPEGTYVLKSAYPNPLASRATIGFELPTAQDVRVTVYDVLGREVAVLVDGVRQAGPQSVELDASSLPSGMYIYRLSAGSTQLTQTFTVVR